MKNLKCATAFVSMGIFHKSLISSFILLILFTFHIELICFSDFMTVLNDILQVRKSYLLIVVNVSELRRFHFSFAFVQTTE